ncbi:MAG: hypothetical protein NVS2B14_16000 [Chamaesiphon sp.]
MPEPQGVYPEGQNTSPDYANLVRFLLQPFLDSPESLSIDCEISQAKSRVWIRLAFEAADKGRVYGRGGRNIQAIRTVIESAAQSVSESVYLDIYGSHAGVPNQESAADDRPSDRTAPSRRAPGSIAPPKAVSKPRLPAGLDE